MTKESQQTGSRLSAVQTGMLSRRSWCERMTGGLYAAALAHLGVARGVGAVNSGFLDIPRPQGPSQAPRARSVIQLFMNGGPSQMDLFDPKPFLDRHHGESYFDKIAGEVENIGSAGSILRSPFRFSQQGQSGMWISELLPHLARQADDLTVIRSMFTTSITHEPALYRIHSGQLRSGHPTLGSWITYGLGSENENLPAYVVLDDPGGLPVNGIENWTAGFLPPTYQGTRFRSQGAPVLNLRPSRPRNAEDAAAEMDFLQRIDAEHLRQHPREPRLRARIASYELAARMQLAAEEALDVGSEPQSMKTAYGVGQPLTDSYAKRCLIARRLVERGVRFVQIFISGQIWDHHTGIQSGLISACGGTDQPIAALLADLKQRGLLESTLVVWGGEFGRLPIAQLAADRSEANAGRDHNKNAFTTWMAGAGVKRGFVLGETDELGLNAVKDRVSVPDWHATLLHLLGLSHETLFMERNGLKERLTGVTDPRVVRDILS